MKLTQILKSEFEQKDQSTALEDFDPITFSMDLQNFNESAESITEKLEELNKANSFVNSLESIVDEVKSFESIDSDKKNKIQEKLKIACESIDVDSGYFDISLESESGSVIEKIIEKIKAVLKHIVEFIKNLKDSIVKYFKDLNNVSIQRENYLKGQLNSFKNNNRTPKVNICEDITSLGIGKNNDNLVSISDSRDFTNVISFITKQNKTFIELSMYKKEIFDDISKIIEISSDGTSGEKLISDDSRISNTIQNCIKSLRELNRTEKYKSFKLIDFELHPYYKDESYLSDHNYKTEDQILSILIREILLSITNYGRGGDKVSLKMKTFESREIVNCLEELIVLNRESFMSSSGLTKKLEELVKSFEKDVQIFVSSTTSSLNNVNSVHDDAIKRHISFNKLLNSFQRFQHSAIYDTLAYSRELQDSFNKLVSFLNKHITCYK